MSDVKKAKGVSALTLGIFLGTIFGFFLAIVIALTVRPAVPDEVCQADCEVRGFHQGQFVTDPRHCTCWNRDFEKPEQAEKETS